MIELVGYSFIERFKLDDNLYVSSENNVLMFASKAEDQW